MCLKTTPKSAFAGLLMILAGAAGARADRPEFAGPFDAGLMSEPTHHEASGLAASRRSDSLYWTHGDSGDGPVLYAVDAAGDRRGRLRLDGVKAVDWEDMASFEIDGTAWLLVADCGDNVPNRPQGVLHVVPEPDPAILEPGREITVSPAYSIHFAYEDLARDCESVAVDAGERTVYLLSKRDEPPRLYRLPLRPAGPRDPAIARRVGTIPHIPQPNELQKRITAPLFAYRAQPTGMDFSSDGRSALVLTYGHMLLFQRTDGESWADALARSPTELGGHRLPQAEAACFSRDGRSIRVCSEKSMRWLRYELRER